MFKSFPQIAAAAVSALALISTSHAAEITVANVSASSTFYTYNPINLINGSGLTGDMHSGDWFNKWITDGVPTGTLTFDLGSAFDLSSTSIWNYGPGCCGDDRSVKDLTISLSTDGIHYADVGTFTLSMPTTNPFGAESIGLGDSAARYVRFSLLSNYGDTSYTGLSEVKFYGVPAVPEADAMAYAAVGAAVVGLALRRRRA
ncbi:MAG TPA: discoidin domain-containing protein [Aquabacterium sp.]|nr:discoidin domain-containing protein [Aquabacterium sp.]